MKKGSKWSNCLGILTFSIQSIACGDLLPGNRSIHRQGTPRLDQSLVDRQLSFGSRTPNQFTNFLAVEAPIRAPHFMLKALLASARGPRARGPGWSDARARRVERNPGFASTIGKATSDPAREDAFRGLDGSRSAPP